jgi:hypothetical protein
MTSRETEKVLPADPVVAALQYASPRIGKPSKSVYRLVIALAAAPIVCGGFAVLMYWLLGWQWYRDSSLMMEILGGVAVLAGIAMLFLFIARERRFRRLAASEFRWKVAVAVVLLVSNVPIIALYVHLPDKLTRKNTVTVVNQTSGTVDRAIVIIGGVKTDLGPVRPGQTVKGSFDMPMTGDLGYELWRTTRNSVSMSGGSVGRGGGVDHVITFTNTGPTFSSK